MDTTQTSQTTDTKQAVGARRAVAAEQVVETEVSEHSGVLATPVALATIDVTDQTTHGLELFEERVTVAKRQLAGALRLTHPGQWIVMDGGDGRQTVYATGGASDRILRFGFGMRWGDKVVVITTDSGGKKKAVARAPLLKQDGSIYEVFEGTRRMGGFTKNEEDLVKGAIENMKHQAVTDILGLRFLLPADFTEMGLDLSRLSRRAEFQDHGPDDAPSLGGPTVPWGRNKGEAVASLEDRDLDYYEKKARDAIADPAKAKFAAKEQRWLDVVLTEKARRVAPAAPPPSVPSSGAEKPNGSALDAEKSSREQEKAQLVAKIMEAALVGGIAEEQAERDVAACKTPRDLKTLLAQYTTKIDRTE